MAAYECGSLDFPEPPYPNTIQCPQVNIDHLEFTWMCLKNICIGYNFLLFSASGSRWFCRLHGGSWGLGNHCQGAYDQETTTISNWSSRWEWRHSAGGWAPPLGSFLHISWRGRQGSQVCARSLREAVIREKKRFFVKSLHKMVTPPSPFYEVPIYFFFVHFLSEKNRWFWRLFEGCWWVF